MSSITKEGKGNAENTTQEDCEYKGRFTIKNSTDDKNVQVFADFL